MQIWRHRRPFKPLLQLLDNLWLVESYFGKQGDGLVRGESDVAVIRAAVFGAIAEGHHGRDDAGGARRHVCDGQAGEDAGAFGETVGFAHDVAGSGRCVGDLLPAGYFGVNAVGPEAVLERFGSGYQIAKESIRGVQSILRQCIRYLSAYALPFRGCPSDRNLCVRESVGDSLARRRRLLRGAGGGLHDLPRGQGRDCIHVCRR